MAEDNRDMNRRFTRAVTTLRAGAVFAVLLLLGCAGLPSQHAAPVLPVYTALPVQQRPSPNFGERRPNYVIIHHTASDDVEHALSTLTSPPTEVSAHYVIARDGRIFYLVDEMKRAWHAGDAYWGGNRDLNSSSIGIELDNNGNEPFAEPQIAALLGLLKDIKARRKIPAANFIGHGDIVPGRKVDPSRWFPWRRLAQQGYGLWCDPPYEAALPNTDDATLLAALGYEITRLPMASAAFKRRWAPDDDETTPLTDAQRGMLQCLIRKQQSGEEGL